MTHSFFLFSFHVGFKCKIKVLTFRSFSLLPSDPSWSWNVKWGFYLVMLLCIKFSHSLGYCMFTEDEPGHKDIFLS